MKTRRESASDFLILPLVFVSSILWYKYSLKDEKVRKSVPYLYTEIKYKSITVYIKK